MLGMLGRNTWLVAKLRCSPHGIALAIREIHSIEAKCVLILLFLFPRNEIRAIVRENVRSPRSFAFPFPFPGGGKSILWKYFSKQVFFKRILLFSRVLLSLEVPPSPPSRSLFEE